VSLVCLVSLVCSLCPVCLVSLVCLVCKVIDEANPIAFVPYCSSLDIKETDVHLEQDVVELCHAGDNFLIDGTLETMRFSSEGIE